MSERKERKEKEREREEREKKEKEEIFLNLESFRRAFTILFFSCWSIEHGSG